MRLTEKCDGGYTYVEYGTEEKIVDKLGKLEDIEEELGCPLEVYVKIVHRDIAIIYESNGVKNIINYGTINRNRFTAVKPFAVIEYAWKDYKKTWWLREDKSE